MGGVVDQAEAQDIAMRQVQGGDKPMSEPFIRVLSSDDRAYVHITIHPPEPPSADEIQRQLTRAVERAVSVMYFHEKQARRWIDLGGES